MNDGSDDRLAPVSYLPWAAPNGGHPAGRGGAAPRRDATIDAVVDEPAAAGGDAPVASLPAASGE